MVHGGGQRDRAVAEPASGRQQKVTLAEIDAGGADVPPGYRLLGDGDVIAVDGRVFLDDDGVGAVGDHAAGKNPHRFAGADGTPERPAGRDFADHLQSRGEVGGVGCAHRIAVHRRHRLRRLRPPRSDVAREDAVIGGVKRDRLFGHGLRARKDRGKRIGNRHQGHWQKLLTRDAVLPRPAQPDCYAIGPLPASGAKRAAARAKTPVR